MTKPPSPNAPSEEPSETRAGRVVRTAAALARHLTRAVGALALTSTLAGTVLWGLLWWPMSLRAGSLLGAAFTLILLLSPAAVLGLFYAALRDLAALPDRLSTHASRTAETSTAAYHVATDSSGAWGDRLRGLAWELWSLRSLLAEHRGLLVRYGAMLRLVTPGFLLLVAVAAGAALLLVPGTGLALLLWGL